jgi:glutathione S-transferase
MASTPARPITLYWDTLSGHSHRVQLFLNLLQLPHDIRRIKLARGEHKQPAYLAINPVGQLPAIDDNGTVMFDSNAILTYLALTYDEARAWFPADPVRAGEVVRFLSFAAGPGLYSGGEARLVTVFGAKIDPQRAFALAARFYPVLENHLAGRAFLVGSGPTIADVANYTYIAHAPEGGISLEAYPNIRAWLRRIEALPHFVPMQRTAVGLQAVD